MSFESDLLGKTNEIDGYCCCCGSSSAFNPTGIGGSSSKVGWGIDGGGGIDTGGDIGRFVTGGVTKLLIKLNRFEILTKWFTLAESQVN